MITKSRDSRVFRIGPRAERVGIISLGCSRNTVDSEKILSDVRRAGSVITSPQKASTVFVNTCAFTRQAKEESLDVIRDLIEGKKEGRIKRIVVCGCLSQRYRKTLSDSFREIDEFRGIEDFKISERSDFSVRLTPAHYAYLKISEGCGNVCSFCAIPAIKGPLRSRSQVDIFQEAERLEKSGVQELNIIGQDITLYGKDFEIRADKRRQLPLARLLKKLLKVTSIPWIRLLYLHPSRITPDLIGLIAGHPRLCPYIDMPIQHINPRILGMMQRDAAKDRIVRLIQTLRTSIADVALRTSLITGFPTEKEGEFQELLDFITLFPFDRLGVFTYSREEGTPAYHYGPQVHEKTKEKRWRQLMAAQREISRNRLSRQIGRTLEVLIDEKESSSSGIYVGRRRQDAPEVDGVVYVKSPRVLKPGAIVSCRISDAYEYDLTAEAIL